MRRLSSLFALIAVILVLATAPVSSARERHPEIRAALDALNVARAHLQAGAHDFHGHRVEALKDVDAAIHEAEICMQED
jgi:pyruvate kinase